MFNTSIIRGTAANGASSGQVMEILEQIAREKLPSNIGVEWSGLSYQEKQAGGQTGALSHWYSCSYFCSFAALYESWSIPIAVLISLPVAVLGAYAGVAYVDWKMIPISRLVWLC